MQFHLSLRGGYGVERLTLASFSLRAWVQRDSVVQNLLGCRQGT